MAEIIEVSTEECLKLREDILTRFPQLRDWTPACEQCSSTHCNVNLDGFSPDEQRALQSLRTASFLLGEKA